MRQRRSLQRTLRFGRQCWKHEGGLEATEWIAAVMVAVVLLGALALGFSGRGGEVGTAAVDVLRQFIATQSGALPNGSAPGGVLPAGVLPDGGSSGATPAALVSGVPLLLSSIVASLSVLTLWTSGFLPPFLVAMVLLVVAGIVGWIRVYAAPPPVSTGDSESTTPYPIRAAILALQQAAWPRAANVPVAVARMSVGAPRTFAPGEFLAGPYNLWSNKPGGGLTSAATAPGFIMEDTTLEEVAEAIAKRLGYTGRYDPNITASHFDEIWHPTSDALAFRAGISQIGVESHGIDPASIARNPGYNPARSVQVTREIPRVRAAGGLMSGLGLLSGGLVLFGASQIQNTAVRYTGYAAGAGEVAGALRYLQGLLMLGRAPGSAAIMSQGALLGRFAGGPGAILLSSYALTHHFETRNYGVMLGDIAGIVGGVAVLVGSAPVAAIAAGVAVANILGDVVEANVTAATGSRLAGVAAGAGAGALAGAAIGAGIGVFFFGVGAPVGAAIGAIIGGLLGIIGAYW